MASTPWRRIALLALLGGVLLVAPFAHQGRILADDAFISMRYAENLAAGQGLVFNPGERVEGYSNLLLVLLLALLRTVGIPTILGVQLVLLAASWLLLALIPVLSERLGGSLAQGALASVALAFMVPFQTWALAGLETSLYGCLLLLGLVAVGRGAPGAVLRPAALVPFALLSITRPEGVVVLGAVAASVALESGLRAAARFLAFTALWALQLLFRLAYYGDRVPNTYHAKVWEGADRWSSGLAYLGKCAGEAGPILYGALALGALLAARRIREPAVRHALATLAALLFFAVSSGGDGFPDGRFVLPALPVALALAVSTLPGRAGRGAALLLLGLVLASPTSREPRESWALVGRALAGDDAAGSWIAARVHHLVAPQETAQQRMGRWLREQVPAGALIAVNDCGQIPWASGHPTLDTVGLMDRHIARQPGRRHEKVDLPYVLNRAPAAIVLRFGKLAAGLPYDTRMASDATFLARYRLAHVVPEGPTGYYAFLRQPDAPGDPVPATVDLLALLPRAERMVLGPEGARPATALEVCQALRWVALPAARIAELDALRPTGEEAASASQVAALDAALRELGPVTHHGIAVALPPGVTAAGIDFDLAGAAAGGGTLRMGSGFAPWLWMQSLTREAASIDVAAKVEAAFATSVNRLSDPVRREEDRGFVPIVVPIPSAPPRLRLHLDVKRAGGEAAASDPFEVMLAEPVIEAALPSGG